MAAASAVIDAAAAIPAVAEEDAAVTAQNSELLTCALHIHQQCAQTIHACRMRLHQWQYHAGCKLVCDFAPGCALL